MSENTWNHSYLSNTSHAVIGAQTPVQGWSLPGTSAYHSPAQTRYILMVEDIPRKRRADTQIKLRIKLLDTSLGNNPASGFQTLYFYKRNAKTTSLNELSPTTLRLFLGVESATTGREITCCEACRVRERSNSFNPGAPGSLALTLARKTWIDFSTGEGTIAFRITCYCTHHEETKGFNVRLLLKNSSDSIIAEAVSDPIMIIDDHKRRSKNAADVVDSISRARAFTTPTMMPPQTAELAEFPILSASSGVLTGIETGAVTPSTSPSFSWGFPFSQFGGIAPMAITPTISAHSDDSFISTSYTSAGSYNPFGSIPSSIEGALSDGSVEQGQTMDTLYRGNTSYYDNYSPHSSSPTTMSYPPASYPPNFTYSPGPASFGTHSFASSSVNARSINPLITNATHGEEAGGTERGRRQASRRRGEIYGGRTVVRERRF